MSPFTNISDAVISNDQCIQTASCTRLATKRARNCDPARGDTRGHGRPATTSGASGPLIDALTAEFSALRATARLFASPLFDKTREAAWLPEGYVEHADFGMPMPHGLASILSRWAASSVNTSEMRERLITFHPEFNYFSDGLEDAFNPDSGTHMVDTGDGIMVPLEFLQSIVTVEWIESSGESNSSDVEGPESETDAKPPARPSAAPQTESTVTGATPGSTNNSDAITNRTDRGPEEPVVRGTLANRVRDEMVRHCMVQAARREPRFESQATGPTRGAASSAGGSGSPQPQSPRVTSRANGLPVPAVFNHSCASTTGSRASAKKTEPAPGAPSVATNTRDTNAAASAQAEGGGHATRGRNAAARVRNENTGGVASAIRANREALPVSNGPARPAPASTQRTPPSEEPGTDGGKLSKRPVPRQQIMALTNCPIAAGSHGSLGRRRALRENESVLLTWSLLGFLHNISRDIGPRLFRVLFERRADVEPTGIRLRASAVLELILTAVAERPSLFLEAVQRGPRTEAGLAHSARPAPPASKIGHGQNARQPGQSGAARQASGPSSPVPIKKWAPPIEAPRKVPGHDQEPPAAAPPVESSTPAATASGRLPVPGSPSGTIEPAWTASPALLEMASIMGTTGVSPQLRFPIVRAGPPGSAVFRGRYLVFGDVSTLPEDLRLQQREFASRASTFAEQLEDADFLDGNLYEYREEQIHRNRSPYDLVYENDQLWGSLMQVARRDRHGYSSQVGLVMYTRGTFITLRMQHGEVIIRHRNSLRLIWSRDPHHPMTHNPVHLHEFEQPNPRAATGAPVATASRPSPSVATPLGQEEGSDTVAQTDLADTASAEGGAQMAEPMAIEEARENASAEPVETQIGMASTANAENGVPMAERMPTEGAEDVTAFDPATADNTAAAGETLPDAPTNGTQTDLASAVADTLVLASDAARSTATIEAANDDGDETEEDGSGTPVLAETPTDTSASRDNENPVPASKSTDSAANGNRDEEQATGE